MIKKNILKRIKYYYGTDLSWLESFTKKTGGKPSGNFIHIPSSIGEGNMYHLDCTDEIAVLYADFVHKVDFKYFQKNKIQDFIGFHYNLSEGEAKISSQGSSYKVGRWLYDFYVMHNSLESEYMVSSGCKCFSVSIFIKKDFLKAYAKKNLVTDREIQKLLNPSKSDFIKLNRMSNESYNLLMELRKNKVGGIVFDLFLTSTVHLLISDFFFKILGANSHMAQNVNDSDLSGIRFSQRFLIENIQKKYPGNKLLAKKINMSETKFKVLFKNITGIPPNVFFMENKLKKAKDLVIENKMSILEISNQLSFANSSYFALKFKRRYGINPEKFRKKSCLARCT
jgi:AraC-like DNA-binding protein